MELRQRALEREYGQIGRFIFAAAQPANVAKDRIAVAKVKLAEIGLVYCTIATDVIGLYGPGCSGRQKLSHT